MMKKKLFVFFMALLPLVALAQKNYAHLLEKYMKAQEAVHEFSGAVLIAKKGKIIYKQAFGQANREWKIFNTVDTRFPIASLTKQFTAAAILQLAEQGKLQTEDKISKYFPGFPKGDSITIHMLLNHTSGIQNILQDPFFTEINVNTRIEALNDTTLVNIFRNKPFDFSPGTWWRYSNSGYFLLGYIIEKLSGLTYRNYVYKNILQKAGMKNSDLFRYDSIILNRAYGYNRTPKGWTNSRIININLSFSAGGLYSTVEDLFAWSEALNAGKIINAASLAKMNRPNREDRGAGYGVFIDKFHNRNAIFHSGALLGFSSFLIRYPVEEICIIILANRETNLDFLHKGLAGILFDKEVLPAYKRSAVKIDTTLLKKYVGEFQGPELPFPLNLVEKNNRLYLRLHRDIELLPESPTKFFVNEPEVELQVEFNLNSEKEVSKAYLIEGGVKMEAKRKLL